MFTGRYEFSIDDKGRTSIPVRFREQLAESSGDRLIVTTDTYPCLLAYPEPEWRTFQQKMQELDEFDEDVIALKRYFLGSAVECPIDRQGRILLTQALREHAGIRGEVVWVGQIEKIEIWAKEKWNELFPSLQEQAKAARRALARRGK
jgi:MraZ protein